MTDWAQRLKRDTCDLIGVFESNLGYELQFPMMHATGDYVTVVVRIERNSAYIYDAGFAAMILTTQGQSLSKKINERASIYAQRMGCQYENGRVSRRADLADVVPAAITVAAVCRYLSDQAALTAAPKPEFLSRVRNALIEVVGKDRMRPTYTAFGASGSDYQPDAVILRKEIEIPAAFVEAISSPKSVATRFRRLYDIKKNDDYQAIDRIAVYNDEEDFESGDLLILQDVSNLVPYRAFSERARAYVQ